MKKMLELYFTSVAIYAIIIACEMYMFHPYMIKNGWNQQNDIKHTGKPIIGLIATSAIPIYRLIVVIILVVMATYTKKQFDEWVEKIQNEYQNEDEDEE
jgi:hypothetical protein